MKNKIIMLSLICIVFVSVANAHPGGLDKNGGHYCWTNCSKWGLEYGEYHCHRDPCFMSTETPDSTVTAGQRQTSTPAPAAASVSTPAPALPLRPISTLLPAETATIAPEITPVTSITYTISAPEPTYNYVATIKPDTTIIPTIKPTTTPYVTTISPVRVTPYVTTVTPVTEPRVKTSWLEEKINALLKWFRWV